MVTNTLNVFAGIVAKLPPSTEVLSAKTGYMYDVRICLQYAVFVGSPPNVTYGWRALDQLFEAVPSKPKHEDVSLFQVFKHLLTDKTVTKLDAKTQGLLHMPLAYEPGVASGSGGCGASLSVVASNVKTKPSIALAKVSAHVDSLFD